MGCSSVDSGAADMRTIVGAPPRRGGAGGRSDAAAGRLPDCAAMQALLDRRLIVVTGKGGVGKSTIAAALGTLAAGAGRRTTIVEVGGQSRMAELFGRRASEPGEETRLRAGLSALTIDPDQALLDWVQELGGRVSSRVLASSGTFQYFAAAAPGAREIVTMIKIWRLAGGRRSGRSGGDLVIVDAPATGHALGMLRSPETFGRIARVGPIVRDTSHVRELLADPARSAYVAVAQGTEMAVTETLELQDGLEAAVGRGLDAVVLNALLPRRFSADELALLDAQAGAETNGSGVPAAAARAARQVHARASYQHGQVTRLRRRGLEVLPVPFVWTAALDLDALEQIALRLAHGMERAGAGAS
jgi:anion-transporting  ArsA/GET3 family ATPase